MADCHCSECNTPEDYDPVDELLAQVSTLEAELREARDNSAGWREESRRMTRDNVSLCDEISEVKAQANDDARRYKWLWPRLACLEQRLNDDGSTSYCFHFTPESYADDIYYADLSMAIDECSGFSGVGQAPTAAEERG